jgi:hypothetical protein
MEYYNLLHPSMFVHDLKKLFHNVYLLMMARYNYYNAPISTSNSLFIGPSVVELGT